MTAREGVARAAQDSKAFRIAARAGYAVLGVVHIVIGVIAISIATGGGGSADQGGAMEQIRQAPAGVFVLWLIVVGMTALAGWQIAEAVMERDPDTKKKWAHRAKFLGTAAAYLAIAATALVFALGGSSDSGQSTASFSAQLMSALAGVVLVALVGLGVLAIGVAFIIRGITKKFTEGLDLPTGTARKGIVVFGMVGYIAKGIAVGVTGILFVVAALTNDPDAARGLDGALHALAALPFGVVILWVVGAGLVIYGVYCFARARYARM